MFQHASEGFGWLFVSGVLIALSAIYAEHRIYVRYESQRNVGAFDEYLAELTRLDTRAKTGECAQQRKISLGQLNPCRDMIVASSVNASIGSQLSDRTDDITFRRRS